MLESSYSLKEIFVFIMYFSGGVGSLILVMILFKLLKILSDIRKITSSTGDITSKLHQVITGPVDLVFNLFGSLTPVIENAVKKFLKKD